VTEVHNRTTSNPELQMNFLSVNANCDLGGILSPLKCDGRINSEL
jgi:hypothetical protein